MIVETYHLTASNTDVLVAPSRLAAIPYAGVLVLELQASENTATNNFEITVQLPNGDVPVQDVRIYDGATLGGMNADDKYSLSFPVAQGGHLLLSATETGTATLDIRCTLMP